MYIDGDIEKLIWNNFQRGVETSKEFGVCVFVVLIIQHAKRMYRTLFSSLDYRNVPKFLT